MDNRKVVLCTQEEIVPNLEAMIFVRISNIFFRMVRAPILAIGLVLAIVLPTQTYGFTRTLDFIIYADGTTHVSQQLGADSSEPVLKVPLYGKTIDNLVIQDEDGKLLSSEMDNKALTIQTFGASSVSIVYDSYDLVSKKGKIWTFAVDPQVDYTVTMPDDSTVVDITNPDNIDSIDNKQISLLKGKNQIEYFFTTSGPALSAQNAINEAKSIISQAVNQKIDVKLAQEKLDLAAIAYDDKKYNDALTLASEAKSIAQKEINNFSENNVNSQNNPVNWFKDNIAGIATSIVAIGGAVSALTLLLKKDQKCSQKNNGAFAK